MYYFWGEMFMTDFVKFTFENICTIAGLIAVECFSESQCVSYWPLQMPDISISHFLYWATYPQNCREIVDFIHHTLSQSSHCHHS